MNNEIIAGRYLLKTLIGQGGMADVYLARDTILDRDVAIKLLRSHLADDAIYVQRFAREANAAATLSHRNIVEIYDVGEDDGKYFIVMEYVPGTTLKELIHKRGALHIEEAIDIMIQLAQGINEAHRHGIIHRDIKPQNILITDSGVLKIADFGIAMIQSLAQVTESTTIMGSLHYLAPEIVRGEKATCQSDIYALGIIFYELLRGKVPFNDEAAINIAMKHMRENMPSIKEFNPTISQGVENVIMKATAKNLDDRYENVDSFLDGIRLAIHQPNQDKLVFQTSTSSDSTVVYDKSTLNEQKENKSKTNKKNKSKYFIIGALSVILIILSFFTFSYIFAPKKLAMPDIIGMTVSEANDYLTEKGLLLDEITRPEENSDKFEKGLIIKTHPAKGEEIREGDKVIITISKGKEIKMENYVGEYYDEAAKKLEKMGFTVFREEEENSNYSAGVVIGQDISAGTTLDNKSNLKITLTVSSGYSVLVDSVVGLDVNTAKKMLEYKGISVKVEVLTPPTDIEEIKNMEINVVIKQTHENEHITSKDTEVTLYYYDQIPELPQTEPVPETPDENNSSEDQLNNNNGGEIDENR